MAHQVIQQHAGPRCPALEEGKLELRKPPRHSSKKQRFADRLRRGCEMPDVIERKIRDRRAKPSSRAWRMKAWIHRQFDALTPHRVVVELAVERDSIQPVSVSACLWCLARGF